MNYWALAMDRTLCALPGRRRARRVAGPALALAAGLLLLGVQSARSDPGASGSPVRASAEAAPARPIAQAIRFGRLLDGTGRVIEDAIVLVEGDRVRAVGGPSTPIPDSARVIDLSHLTGIPGLIDAHTHLTYYWDGAPGTRPWVQLASRMPAATLYLAQENALRTLEAGVTTARDLGSFEYIDLAMRDLIATGAMRGPRLLVSGYGLHPTYSKHDPRETYFDAGLADGVDEVRKVARQQIAAGIDQLKVYASTGSANDVTGYRRYSAGEIEAAIEEARSRGKPVAVHSYGPAAAADAVRFGATTLEHATDLDDATLREMARRGVIYVPTVDHNRYYAEEADAFGYTREEVEALDAYRARNLQTLRRAIRAKVKVAMGSDALFTMCGQNTRELLWFVEAGMTPRQALAAATTVAAEALGMGRELGAVAPGYYADLVALEGDPLADVRALVEGVRWVMKGGVVMVDLQRLP